MSRTTSIDAAAHRASSEYYLLNDLAIQLSEDKTEYYLAKFNEHFTYMRNADTLTNIRNAHTKFISDIQSDIRIAVAALPKGSQIRYDEEANPTSIKVMKPVNFKVG